LFVNRPCSLKRVWACVSVQGGGKAGEGGVGSAEKTVRARDDFHREKPRVGKNWKSSSKKRLNRNKTRNAPTCSSPLKARTCTSAALATRRKGGSGGESGCGKRER